MINLPSMPRSFKWFLLFLVAGYFHYFINKDRFKGMGMKVSLYSSCKYSCTTGHFWVLHSAMLKSRSPLII
jgi:hypothetical protein